jgi:hypothetical protein
MTMVVTLRFLGVLVGLLGAMIIIGVEDKIKNLSFFLSYL